MLDLVYLAAIVAVFVVVGLIATGVDKLGPRSAGSVRREAADGEEWG